MTDVIVLSAAVAIVASGLILLPVAWWATNARASRATSLELIDERGETRLHSGVGACIWASMPMARRASPCSR